MIKWLYAGFGFGIANGIVDSIVNTANAHILRRKTAEVQQNFVTKYEAQRKLMEDAQRSFIKMQKEPGASQFIPKTTPYL